MQKIKQLFFPKQSDKIFKGFGPAFLAIAMGIGSGEFILWPYLTTHYGFGILWGALLGITIQLAIIVAVEKNTAFLGENIIVSFRRIFKYSFGWILFSTIIGFGWPGFSAMASNLFINGFGFDMNIHGWVSLIFLCLAAFALVIHKNAYKSILFLQKINLSLLLILITSLFIYYFDVNIFLKMIVGFGGVGDGFIFIPAGLSLITFMGAIVYAGSGGNLLLANSFFVENEQKGLVGQKETDSEMIIPENNPESIVNAKNFTRSSWKQNALFFWGTGLLIIVLLSYVSYAVLYGNIAISDDFSFLIEEAMIFSRDIHPLVGKLFIFSGVFAIFGVQLGIFDFIGRISKTIKKYSKFNHISDTLAYRTGVLATTLFGATILLLGVNQPSFLIITGASLNALSMGVLAWLLYKVEKNLLPDYLQSKFFKGLMILTSIFYLVFFTYVVADKFIF